MTAASSQTLVPFENLVYVFGFAEATPSFDNVKLEFGFEFLLEKQRHWKQIILNWKVEYFQWENHL